jgi:thiamine-phosphate pyrophosphorylase
VYTLKEKNTNKTQTPKDLHDLRLFLITDRLLFKDQKYFLTAVESALMGGVKALQLREKDLPDSELIKLGIQLRKLTLSYRARLIINSRVDIAKKIGADGVHLTESSISINDIKTSFPSLILGVSTHSIEGAHHAQTQGADYITFSPIYDTPSKASYGPPQGLDSLLQITQAVSLPVLALGGITLDRVPECLEQGAFGVALISDIWDSSNIKQHSFEYMQNFGGNIL